MINKQLMSLTFSHHNAWNGSLNVLIVTLITQNTKFILAFKFFSRPNFCLSHSLTKNVSFPLNSSNDALIGFPPCAN